MARSILNLFAAATAYATFSACGVLDFASPELAAGGPGAGASNMGGQSALGSGGHAGSFASSGGERSGGEAGTGAGGEGAESQGGAAGAGNAPSRGGAGQGGSAQGGTHQGGASRGGALNQGGTLEPVQGGSTGSGGQHGGAGGTEPQQTGGNAGSGGEGCNGSLSFPSPSTVVVDRFDHTGDLGAHWLTADTDGFQGYTLIDDQLSTASISQDPIVWGNAFGKNQEAFVTLVSWDPQLYGTWLILKSRSVNVENFAIAIWYAEQFNGSPVLSISVNDGSWQDAKSRSDIKIEKGQVLGARAFANGCVEAFVDGGLVLTADLAALGFSKSGYSAATSYVGLGNLGQDYAPAPTVWDDFGAGTLP